MKDYQGNHKNGEIEIEEEVIVFENRFLRLYNDKVIFPNGSKGSYVRLRWNAPYGTVIIPTTKDGKILLIKTFKHEYRKWGWEVPKGFGTEGLSPLDNAKKELLEETGYTTDNWEMIKKVNDFYDNEGTYIFKAIFDEMKFQSKELEDEEAISGHKIFSKEEIKKLILSDEVQDQLTLFCLAYISIQ